MQGPTEHKIYIITTELSALIFMSSALGRAVDINASIVNWGPIHLLVQNNLDHAEHTAATHLRVVALRKTMDFYRIRLFFQNLFVLY